MTLRNGFILGDWTVYPLEGRLQRGEESQRVQPKSMDVLLCLAEADGTVVERDELLRHIWGERAVSDEPLTRCIGELRRALGDNRGDPQYILTVPKRGYRLLQAAAALPEEESPRRLSEVPPMSADQKALRAGTLKKIGAALGVIVLAVAASQLVSHWRGLPADVDGQLGTATSSIAVLPFEDMTEAQDQAYFGDGLAEELINLLAQNPALRVASRTSSFSFRGHASPVTEIAEQLDVRYIVEGSVRRDGDEVRITAQLIRADEDFHVWSETFDDSVDDIFAIQDRISQQVATALEVSVLDGSSASRRTSPQAYTLYLQGKYSARVGSRESLEQAIVYFEEALSADPDYAPAWADLAVVYSNLGGQGHWGWDEGFKASRIAATRAVAADPEYSGGYQSLAWIAHRYEGDLAAAMEYLQQALDLDARNFNLLRHAAVLLLQFGRVDKAIELLEYCAERSPMDPGGHFNLGVAYKYGDSLAKAEATFLRIRERHPEYHGTIAQLGELTLLQDRPAESLAWFEQLDGHRRARGVAVAQHALGDRDASDAALAELVDGWGDEYQMAVAEVHAFRDELDDAFLWLERDLERWGTGGWGEVRLQRLFDNLRGDPRWLDILERTGVSDAALAAYDLRINVLGD